MLSRLVLYYYFSFHATLLFSHVNIEIEDKNCWTFSYSKILTKFEVFCLVISSNINIFFLKSAVEV